jgi:linoleoyl-CoA desaturase
MAPAPTPRTHFSLSDTPFRRELLARVDAWFAAHPGREATPALWLKVACWLGSFAASWAVLTFASLPWWASVPGYLWLGFSVAQVGFNVGHDAIHGALSRSKGVNALFARSFDLMGSSSLTWEWAHNRVHHTFTNVAQVDHDLEPGPFLRFTPRQPRLAVHRAQHVYAWPLYALTTMVWVFKKDVAQLFEMKARGQPVGVRQVLDVVLGKLFHLAVFVGVPLLVGRHSVAQTLWGYALTLMASGFTAAVVFQLAHVVEGPQFPQAGEDGELLGDYFSHQLRTTSNFAPRSAIAGFFTGGLNHQVEHHLFPRIAHAHYPALAPIVEACAKEYGVPYLSHPTFRAALVSHTRQLKALGAEVWAHGPAAQPA